MSNEFLNAPGWEAVRRRMISLLPMIPPKECLCPDAIFEAASKGSVPIASVMLYNPWRSTPEGRGETAFEDYENVELFDEVFADYPPVPGPLWFIPDDCWFECREPYMVEGARLRDFVATCDCCMTQDVLFVWCESPRVTVIHHEGMFFHLNVTPM